MTRPKTLEAIYGKTFARHSEQYDFPNKFLEGLQTLYQELWKPEMSRGSFELAVSILKELLRRGYTWEEAGILMK